MYNMDISIFGYKFNLEILILIGVIYLILVGHTFCGCSNYSLMEGLDVMTSKPENVMMGTQVSPVNTDGSGNNAPDPASPGDVSKNNQKSGSAQPFKTLEGFAGANTNYGESSSYSLYSNNPVNTASWGTPDLSVVSGKPLSPGVKAFLGRPKQQVPLPDGEMLMFANTKFAPEYCPNTYSNSSGCAAMTGDQYNYLITRGGNNMPYSEY